MVLYKDIFPYIQCVDWFHFSSKLWQSSIYNFNELIVSALNDYIVKMNILLANCDFVYVHTKTVSSDNRKWCIFCKAALKLHLKKMRGCFNPNLGQIWTNPNVGLKMSFKIWTQLQLSFWTVICLITF